MENCHFLVVTFPGQGHINPTLQFAKRLAKLGVRTTFSTSLGAINRMNRASDSLPEKLSIVAFSDGYDHGWTTDDDVQIYMTSLITRGSQTLKDLIMAQSNEGRPITHVVYTTLMPWVGQVARQLQIPSTLLWIQPAALFQLYYCFFNGCGEVTGDISSSKTIKLPGLPTLASRDLPTFFLASNPDVYSFALPTINKHFELLQEEETPKVLVNTFDALESETLMAAVKLKPVAVGPLIPSAFLDGRDSSDSSFGGDLLQETKDCVEWLNSKNDASVVYVAFGSFADVPLKQLEEIAQGLLQSKKPFLWVLRKSPKGEKLEEKLSCKDELEKQGLIVSWCSQVEVLSHPSVGCFVSHCGWNSSLESLASGVPVVAIPLWTDQTTNAKFIQDVWKTGIRPTANEEGTVEADEIRRSVEIVMDGGVRGEEMRKTAKKWRELAVEAAKDGGSSSRNVKAFVDEVAAGVIRG
ncbi:UDP-glycosyltransferase 75C1-like [Coffea eugenioides]|uniref:UDP-glycosyltransferase 75C1-like n=1 Tax=Coffea eugenioides TaxID=49369 RepID=UPI000F60EF9E|nr:UDP-glycosyltransferase 75C1-like [Coffea eugenioides]